MAIREPEILSLPEKLLLAAEIGGLGLWEMDLRDGTKTVDKRLVKMLGYELEEVDSTVEFWNGLIHPDDRERVRKELQAYLTGKTDAFHSEYRLATKTGQWKWILDRGATTQWDQNSRPRIVFGVQQEIQERKFIERDLIRERNKLEAVISALGDGLTVQDRNFTILYQNEVQKKRQGMHEGEPCYAAYQGRDEVCEGCLVVKCFEDGQVHRREASATTPDGEELFMEVSASPLKDSDGNIVGAVETVRDITSRKLLERQLRQSHKLEAVGTLAGGIAHDFNNILAVMLGYAEIAIMNSARESEIIQDLEKILIAGNRAKELVGQILTFSRQAQVERMLLKPQPIIKEVLNLIRASIPKTITIRKDISSADVVIDIDPTQFHQILMNLCVNAFHAMEEHGGVLEVVFKPVESVPPELLAKEGARKTHFAKLSIKDTGQGIAPEYIDKIFDPFFTTKEKGKGTGMGLATIYGIVKDCGGAITVDSSIGRGATFHVCLPVADPRNITAVQEDDNAMEGGSERILFVDDEELLVEVGKTMLERLGYDVTSAQDGIAAWETFRNKPDKFDLIITDQTMPGMTGLELTEKILQLRPDMPIILCTGYSKSVNEEVAKTHGIREFALKPLTRNSIASIIRRSLE